MNRIRVAAVALVIMFCTLLPMNSLLVSAEEVKSSSQEYEVYFSGNHSSFLCNKKTVGNKPGTEYYLTYTVEKATSSGLQNGLLGTCAPQTEFPYIDGNGRLYYVQRETEKDEAPLLLEGYTYFIKYTVTESGFRYIASRAKDDSSEYFVIENKFSQGEPKSTNYGYFGLWLANGNTTAHLSNVRFYDKAGNDLGVWSPWSKATVAKSGITQKDTQVEHWYRVEARDLVNLAISNETPLTTDKMYIEYTVSESESTCRQTGVSNSNYPDVTYPHERGLLRFQGKDNEVDCLLLQPGADYLIMLEKGEHGFSAYVQITKDGKTSFVTFPQLSGKFDPDAQYFSLWFGQGGDWKANFVLDNVKFYDSNRNNLGAQSNNSAALIRHFGAMTDYAGCEGIYYCEDDGSFYKLYETKEVIYEKDGKSIKGTYSISENKITLVSERGTETCDYLYRGFTTKDGNYYKRLYTYNVSFVAGNGNPIEKQVLNMENGYLAKQPEDPVLDGCQFEGWCTSDGKAYDFSTVVTSSKVLYAKWSDGAGVEYLAVGEDEIVKLDTTPYVSVAICSVLIIVTIVGIVLIKRRTR